MASGKVSKNSRTSKPKEIFKPVKERKKKEFIYIELTKIVYEAFKNDLSEIYGKPVDSIIERYGKKYLKVKNT
jgi:hypothetical protein